MQDASAEDLFRLNRPQRALACSARLPAQALRCRQ